MTLEVQVEKPSKVQSILNCLPAIPVMLKGATFILLGAGSIAQVIGHQDVANALYAVCSALGLKQVSVEAKQD